MIIKLQVAKFKYNVCLWLLLSLNFKKLHRLSNFLAKINLQFLKYFSIKVNKSQLSKNQQNFYYNKNTGDKSIKENFTCI